MALIPWKPFRDLERFFEEEWEPFLPEPSHVFHPAMDIYESGNNLIAEVNLAGIDPKNVNVSLEDNVLRIEGKQEEKKEEKKKGYYCKEIRKGAFKRSAALPVEVQAAKAKAEFSDGILKVIMPKAEPKKEKKGKKLAIKIKK